MNAAISAQSGLSTDLPTLRNEHRCMQHWFSAVVSMALLLRLLQKMTIAPECWSEASRPRRGVLFATAEESSVAKDSLFRSHSTRPQRAP